MADSGESGRYEVAKDDPVAGIVLDALHTQDASTYHGRSGDIGGLALATARAVEQVIRRQERHRLADLLEADASTLGDFAPDPTAAVRLIAYMLRLDDGAAHFGSSEQADA